MIGLGRMFAKALEANGAEKVYIIGRRWDKLENVAKESVSIIPRSQNISRQAP
jgi:NADP-dependent 3-hydroxy acid dehydrogenase YdfG